MNALDYDVDDTLCAQCDSKIPNIETDYTHEGFCSPECFEMNTKEEESRTYFGCYDDTLPGAPEYWEVL